MTLLSGSRLGPYEILAALGAGGMGEVYRARDTRLDRDIAVKILKPHASRRSRTITSCSTFSRRTSRVWKRGRA